MKTINFRLLSLKNIDQLLGKNLLYLWIVVLIIIVLYYQLFFAPTLKQMFSLGSEVEKLKNNIDQIQNKLANKEALEQKRDALIKKINFYEQELSSEKEIPALLENLSELAKETDVKIDFIEPLKVESLSKSKLYQEVPILIRGKCSYHQLGYFVNKLENSARFMKIKDINIIGNTKAYGKHSFTLKVVIYVFKIQS